MFGIYYATGIGSDTSLKGIQSIEFDATLEELHDWQNEVTQNPVEEGAPVSDHIIATPDKLRLSGVITNSPLRGEFAGQYFGGDTASPRIQTTFEALRALHEARDTITAYTKHAVYRDMAIQSISIPRNAQIGEEVQFTMELVNIRMVRTQMVALPPGISAKKAAKSGGASGPVAKKSEPQKSGGDKESENLAKKYPKPETSILKSVGAALRG